MFHYLRLALILSLALLAPSPAASACLPDGVQTSGAKYRICLPAPGFWNGSLVVYAHGYVAFNEPIAIPEDQLVLPDGTSVPGLINALGFAFAASSYSVNGLAIQQGVEDTADLVQIFSTTVGTPKRVFLVGPSEGGIVTALSIERRPDLYAGGLAACGPIGDFPAQINYIGDFRVIFDYFFPGVLPGSIVDVPPSVIDNWESVYVPAIKAAIKARPQAAAQLLNVTGAQIGGDPANVENTVVSLLWYSAFTTNDAKLKLGGQPFDNAKRFYTGSSNDLLLNLRVARFSADPAAVSEMKSKYNASGALSKPLVTLHTTGDQIIPYWHEPLYSFKTLLKGSSSQHVNIPIFRYGHCNFKAAEALFAFVILVQKTGGSLSVGDDVLPTQSRQEYLQLMRNTR
jgi:pimeloyl-ACP methyl ester carboxylesterase